MKNKLRAILIPVILSVALVTAGGCAKKDTGPSPEEIAAAQAAEQAAAEAAAQAAAEAAAKAEAEAQAKLEAEEKAKAIAEAEALALALAAQQAEEEAKALAEAKAAAEAKAKEEARLAAEAKAKAEREAREAAEAQARAEAEAAAAMKAKAAALYEEHLQAAEEFAKNTKALSDLIDQNPSLVSVQVAEGVLEMRAIMPSLIEEYESLKDYQGDDLDATVAAIREDYDRAEQLYTDTLALLSDELRMTLE